MNTISSDDRARGDDLVRTQTSILIRDKRTLGFDTIEQIDLDEDLWFQLRGHGYNPLVDGALPLFGLVIRIRKLQAYDDVVDLYAKVRNQIAALGEEGRQHDYDGATQLAFRYCLCAFVDEAVMGTAWGAQSSWAERSLLSVHHDETWGGEKFFTVMSRMQMEPKKYRDMLEFMYLCLCLGFKGKYSVQFSGNEELQIIISKLHRVLRELRGETPERLTDALSNVASRHYRVGRQWPWWTPWAVAGLVLVVAFVIYSLRLELTTRQVLQSLDSILKT